MIDRLIEQRVIDFIDQKLEGSHHEMLHASGDADVLIATAAVCIADKSDTVIVGDDTDLLVLLCYYYRQNTSHRL